MEMFNFDYDEVVELGSRSRGTTGKKRKWREIEALKDKHRLQKELQSIDIAYEGLRSCNPSISPMKVLQTRLNCNTARHL